MLLLAILKKRGYQGWVPRTLICDNQCLELALTVPVRRLRPRRITPPALKVREAKEPGKLGVGVSLVAFRTDAHVHHLGDLLAVL